MVSSISRRNLEIKLIYNAGVLKLVMELGHIPLKVTNIEYFFILGFQCMCTDRSKPKVKIELMSPYHSVQMRC